MRNLLDIFVPFDHRKAYTFRAGVRKAAAGALRGQDANGFGLRFDRRNRNARHARRQSGKADP